MSRSTRALGGPRARLLAVDDHAPFLALLREVVRATMHLELVGEAQSGERAIPAAQELRPDMILMDIDMPGIGGIKAAEQIQGDIPSTLMVLISATHPTTFRPGCTAAALEGSSGRACSNPSCSTTSGRDTTLILATDASRDQLRDRPPHATADHPGSLRQPAGDIDLGMDAGTSASANAETTGDESVAMITELRKSVSSRAGAKRSVMAPARGAPSAWCLASKRDTRWRRF
jgi:chemotaxis response regulator CheB